MAMTIDNWIQLGVAIGTISVAILAIWGDRIRYLLGLGPKLRISLAEPQGEVVPISEAGGSRTPARYYHIRVSNSRKWTQATNVRVVIVGLAKPAADGKLAASPLIAPLQLMWRFSDYHSPVSVVGPDDWCDLGFLKQGENFKLTPYVFPNNFPGLVKAKKRILVEIKAIADNAESESLCIDISWNGRWADDTLEMSKNLVVKEVDCLGSS